MHIKKYFALSITLIASASLSGCALGGSSSPLKFQHAQHGVVNANNTTLKADRDACGRDVYASGISIKGKRITKRMAAIKIYASDLVNLNLRPGAGAMAGVQGAMAVRGHGNPYASSTASRPNKLVQPAYYPAFQAMEDKVFACVERKGWKKLPKKG